MARGVGILRLECRRERLRSADVRALELFVERGRAEGGAQLVGHGLDQTGVSLVEGLDRLLLDVEHSPQLRADPDRCHQLRADALRVLRREIVGVARNVVHDQRAPVTEAAPDDARAARLAPS